MMAVGIAAAPVDEEEAADALLVAAVEVVVSEAEERAMLEDLVVEFPEVVELLNLPVTEAVELLLPVVSGTEVTVGACWARK